MFTRQARVLTRILILALLAIGLVACGRKSSNAPLSYVPADTSFVFANIQPINENQFKLQSRMFAISLPMQIASLRKLSQKFKTNDPHAAGLLDAFANELDQGSLQAIAKHSGIRLKGLTAIYGIGLTPVARFQINDINAFQAMIQRLQNGYGQAFPKTMLGKQAYWHIALGKAPIQILIAIEGQQGVLALAPGKANPELLKRILGIQRPEKSLQSTGQLNELADHYGYRKDSIITDIHIDRIIKTVFNGKDPMLLTLLKNKMPVLPANCAVDAERIASRVPEISGGATRIKADQYSKRIDIRLAPDIIKAFSTLPTYLPGLKSIDKASLAILLAVPVAKIRDFWIAQADAVAAKPFTCGKLTNLNRAFARMRANLPKLGIPPIGELTGIGIVIDQLPTPHSTGKMTGLRAHAIVTSSNPQGLLALSQATVPGLRNTHIKPDSVPVPINAPKLSTRIAEPLWLALNSHHIGVAVGQNGNEKLAKLMKAAPAQPGFLMAMHYTGVAMSRLLDNFVTMQTRRIAHTPRSSTALRAKLHQALQNIRKQMQMIRSTNIEIRMGKQGLVLTSQTEIKPN